MAVPASDKRLLKLIVGLALESELYNDRENRQLRRLYSNPDLREIQSYYKRLVSSGSSYDREAAFWLEHALEQGSTSVDLSMLVVRLQQVEAILYSLLMEGAYDSSRDLNDWLNYVANAGESLKGNYLLDAKILVSRAMESSDRTLAAVDTRDPRRRYELGILKTETMKIFEELKTVHSKLTVVEELLEIHLKIQTALIELLTLLREGDGAKEAVEELHYSAQKLVSAQRLLLRSKKEVLRAGQEVALAQQYVGIGLEKSLNPEIKARLNKVLQQLRSLALEADV